MKVWKKRSEDEEEEMVIRGGVSRRTDFFQKIINMNGRKKQGFDISTENL